MAKVQSRRTVCLNRAVFEDLKRYCGAIDVTVSQFTEDVVRIAMRRGYKPSRSRKGQTRGLSGVFEV